MTVAWLVLVAVGFAGAFTFVLLYFFGTPTWYRTAMGRILMAGAAVLAGLFGLTLLTVVVRMPAWLWIGGMASLDVVLWAQVYQLWKIQHRHPPTPN